MYSFESIAGSEIVVMDIKSTFIMAFLPVLKIFITCGIGAYLGHPDVNILTGDGRKSLNKLVVVAFTPAFVFTKLARSVSYENIVNWWYMPVSIMICFACGAALGTLVVKYTSVPPHFKTLIIACCSAGNSGNVALVLIPSICEEKGSPFGASEVCTQNAVTYISYGMWTGIALIWTVIYRLLQPAGFHKAEGNPVAAAASVAPGGSSCAPSSPCASSDHWDFQSGDQVCHDMEDVNRSCSSGSSSSLGAHGMSKLISNNLSSTSVLMPPSHEVSRGALLGPPQQAAAHSLAVGAPDFLRDLKAYFQFIVEKYDLKTVCNPPTCAAILGLLVGGIPPLKSLCEGPFLIFLESGDIIGQAMIPAMNMVLGASLVQGQGASELPIPSIISVILVRLVALPILGMISISAVNAWGLLPVDPLFRFVLMLQHTMPTAINIGTMAQLFGVGERESSLVLFYVYLSASFFLTFWIMIYLHYIFI